MTSKRWFPLASMIALAGCPGSTPSEGSGAGGSGAPPGGEQQGTAQSTSNMGTDGATTATDASAAGPTPPTPAATVVAGTATPLPANLRPRVAITAPRDNSTVRTNRAEVRLRVTDWPAPQDARHVHLILDNEPYRRIDNPGQPVVLENLAEGTHVLRAFPGWASHESVKTPGAFAVSVFHVGHPTANFSFNRAAPLLTYSRPKGDYNGTDADRVLLDFYVSNVPGNQLAATGFRVRYSIDGSTNGEITSWVPHYIERLGDGAHTIAIELLGADGQPAAGPFNRTERTINVNHAAPAAPPHAGHAMGDAGVMPATDGGH